MKFLRKRPLRKKHLRKEHLGKQIRIGAIALLMPLLVWANTDVRLLPGFVVLAEQRFDPAIQRFMAERSLAALPLRDGQLYYVYPLDAPRAQVEQMQIRYLEALLSREAEKNAADVEPGNP